MLLYSVDDVAFEIVDHISLPSDYKYFCQKVKERFEPATCILERLLQFCSIQQAKQNKLNAFTNACFLLQGRPFQKLCKWMNSICK